MHRMLRSLDPNILHRVNSMENALVDGVPEVIAAAQACSSAQERHRRHTAKTNGLRHRIREIEARRTALQSEAAGIERTRSSIALEIATGARDVEDRKLFARLQDLQRQVGVIEVALPAMRQQLKELEGLAQHICNASVDGDLALEDVRIAAKIDIAQRR